MSPFSCSPLLSPCQSSFFACKGSLIIIRDLPVSIKLCRPIHHSLVVPMQSNARLMVQSSCSTNVLRPLCLQAACCLQAASARPPVTCTPLFVVFCLLDAPPPQTKQHEKELMVDCFDVLCKSQNLVAKLSCITDLN